MSLTPPDPLHNAIWFALKTAHAHLALQHGQAVRYPTSVAPFAAISEPGLCIQEAVAEDLVSLLQPGESVYLMGPRPSSLTGLGFDGSIPCLQMVFAEEAPLPAPPPHLPLPSSLDCAQAADMLALISVAFPGFFREETCRMGRYWGIRDRSNSLIAMGGERLILTLPGQPAWRELSGICVHPEHSGGGLGSAILACVLAQHRAEGSRSWLHVSENNIRAIELYRRLGFTIHRSVELHRLKRNAS